MINLKFDKEITALLVIDPYNDFISEGGKIRDRIKSVAEANDCVSHMLQLLTEARKTGVRVFYAMHHRYRPGRDLEVQCPDSESSLVAKNV
jgi:ureidoacrylate peracid hydrolase